VAKENNINTSLDFITRSVKGITSSIFDGVIGTGLYVLEQIADIIDYQVSKFPTNEIVDFIYEMDYGLSLFGASTVDLYMTMFYFKYAINGLLNISQTSTATEMKQKLIDDLRLYIKNYDIYAWDPDYLIEQIFVKDMQRVRNQLLGFRNVLYGVLKDLDSKIYSNKLDIEMIVDMWEQFQDTFALRVQIVTDEYYSHFFDFITNWYENGYVPLVDSINNFEVEYIDFVKHVNEIEEVVEQGVVDLSDIMKKLNTPFSNVYSIKQDDNESFNFELHLLKNLVIEALALDFPSVRETMLENLDTILGVKQQEKISEVETNVRPYESRR